MYKLIITSGCSFSEGSDTWVCELESYYRDINPSCEFQHLAVPSQGNELIQKKAVKAVLSALTRFQAEEVALFVMWSTHDRRGFYLPKDTRDLIRTRVIGSQPIPQQFTDLSGQALSGAGWYHCHGSTSGDNPVSDFYYTHIHSLELGIHVTLENMLLLDLVVSKLGVFSCSMLIMSSVYDLISGQRAGDLTGHLYSAIDWTKFDLQGEYDYLRGQPSPEQYFRPDGWHPNRRGHRLWFQQRLVPRIVGK